ncbi:uncharacterized protein QC764_705620 [Podospora pseudoanserina]|uniref:Uncharacterized protein n=1 Tax=Podospora pseudoanserina TaxID=2609844 RepID=A0ABR0HJZ0_9PEZI|nr:hypothetical protein QC764_705620 [Podospora pseudoanserina]
MDGYILVPHEKYLTSCSRNLGTLDLNLECPTSYPFPKAQPKQTLFTSRNKHYSPAATNVTQSFTGLEQPPRCGDLSQLPRFQKHSSPFVSIPSGLIEPHRPKLTIHRHLHIQLHLRHQPRTIVRPLLPLTLPLIGHNRPNLSSISPIHPLVVIASQLPQPELSKRRSFVARGLGMPYAEGNTRSRAGGYVYTFNGVFGCGTPYLQANRSKPAELT